jgi:MYXO-CTERM domain-containing protein
MKRAALLVGYASAAMFVAMPGEVRAQNLGDQCPLSEVGKPCTVAGTCLKFTCDLQSSGGASKTETLGFCDGTTNLCPPGSTYMGACGKAGKCVAGGVGFAGPGPEGGTMSCQGGIYMCAERLPGFPKDAGPIRSTQGGFGVDAGAVLLGVDGGVGKSQAAHGSASEAGAAGVGGAGATKPTSSSSSSGGCSISLGRAPTSPWTFAVASLAAAAMLRPRRGPLGRGPTPS